MGIEADLKAILQLDREHDEFSKVELEHPWGLDFIVLVGMQYLVCQLLWRFAEKELLLSSMN